MAPATASGVGWSSIRSRRIRIRLPGSSAEADGASGTTTTFQPPSGSSALRSFSSPARPLRLVQALPVKGARSFSRRWPISARSVAGSTFAVWLTSAPGSHQIPSAAIPSRISATMVCRIRPFRGRDFATARPTMRIASIMSASSISSVSSASGPGRYSAGRPPGLIRSTAGSDQCASALSAPSWMTSVASPSDTKTFCRCASLAARHIASHSRR